MYETIGLTIIVISLMMIDDKSGWPTAWLALPMLGTYLSIAACNERSLLRSAFFQKIGLWSYSIYLVHWPIVVFAAAMGLAKYSLLWLIPIFFLGYLLHVLIEKRRNFTKKFTAFYFAVATLIYFIDANNLIIHVRQSSLHSYELYGGSSVAQANTTLVGSDKPKFIFQGDSLSREFGNALIERNISGIINNKDGCYSIGNHFGDPYLFTGTKDIKDKCFILYEKTKLLASKYADLPIVFIHSWPNRETKELPKRIEELGYSKETVKYSDLASKALFSDIAQVAEDFPGRDIYFVGKKQGNKYFTTGQTVNFHMISPSVARFLNINENDNPPSEYENFAMNDIIQAAIDHINIRRSNGEPVANAHYIDPNVYCTNGTCKIFLDDYVQIYSDELHYSWAGSHKPLTHILQSIGVDPKDEPKDLRITPDIDFDKHQLVLEYSPESGFKFPE